MNNIDPYVWRLAKLAIYLMVFGYAPMVIALKVLRGNHAFELIGHWFGL